MTQLVSKVQKLFASSGTDTQFGSTITGTPVNTTDPSVIQSLPAWLSGWGSATETQQSGGINYYTPTLEEMNGLLYSLSYYIVSSQQRGGLFEYDSAVTYNLSPQPSIVANPGTTQLYVSLANNNTGNALSNGTYWALLGDLTTLGNALLKANNLSDLASVSTARTNLGLGTASTQNVGTASGTIPVNGTSSATNTIAGVMQIATQAQVVAGTDNATAVSPYALQALPYYINPYSVTSANVDSNGYASFISSASSSSVTFNVTVPIVCCYPNGVVESNPTLANITGMSTNTTYYIYKIYGSVASATTLQPVEAIVAPTSPSTGQLWLNIGVKPYIGYQWSGSAWVATNFVKLGQVTISGGVMGTPISYALNGYYINRDIAVANNGTYIMSHNIGSYYQNIVVYCKSSTGSQPNIIVQPYTYFPGSGVIQARGYQPSLSSPINTTIYTGNQSISANQVYGGATVGDITSGFYDIIIKRSF